MYFINIKFPFFFSSGRTQKRKGVRQDKELVLAATNGTSQQISFDSSELCNDEDVMDCLVSFYGDVP